MNDLEQMYQQVIMEHARAGHGRGLQETTAAEVGESHQFNTTCGDEVKLRVGVDGSAISSLTWEGQGCSISQASVSVLHELVEGGSVDHAVELNAAFIDLMHSKGEGIDDAREDLLGDATAFTGVGKYPLRVKCAVMGWMALKDALIQTGKVTS